MQMDATSKTKSASETSPWHAVTADEVVKRLATSIEKGLDAGEASSSSAEVRAEPAT